MFNWHVALRELFWSVFHLFFLLCNFSCSAACPFSIAWHSCCNLLNLFFLLLREKVLIARFFRQKAWKHDTVYQEELPEKIVSQVHSLMAIFTTFSPNPERGWAAVPLRCNESSDDPTASSQPTIFRNRFCCAQTKRACVTIVSSH